jgi:sigma-B regulation protein RsbU (phosphoserine phosphatase)
MGRPPASAAIAAQGNSTKRMFVSEVTWSPRMTDPETAPSIPDPDPHEPRPRLLLVDDDPANLQVLYRTLEPEGYEFVIAQSGEEALRVAPDARPALILLDIKMPGIGGFETCRRLKSDSQTRDSPIIFMSALTDAQDKVLGFDLGAVDYITKPFDAGEVRARIRTHLELRRLNRELAEMNEDLLAVNLRLKRDLEAAAKVQRALLPTQAPVLSGYAFAWRYRPCEELAGDALNVFPLHDTQIGAYVLDVSGHGVAASLLAVSVTHDMVPRSGAPSVVMDAVTGRIDPPSLVAARLNELYPMADRANRYFTLAYGVLDAKTGSFRYVCAGHPAPVLIRGQEVKSVENPNIPIGMVPKAEYEEEIIELLPGDRLYLYSDGFVDETNSQGREFGLTRLHAELLSTCGLPLSQSVDGLIAAVVTWRGVEKLSDDVTVVAIEHLDAQQSVHFTGDA